MKRGREILTWLGIATVATGAFPIQAVARIDNVVLVHGANMDGGAWRAVYDRLTADGHRVTIVQLPTTSTQEDIAATQRALDAQVGPVVLVGHSYGGLVISRAGTDPDVKALVYVAAFQPDIGESLASLNASAPSELPADALRVSGDGYYVVEPKAWIAYVANGLSEAEAGYTAAFQTPANTSIFSYKAEAAAWRHVPSWSVIASRDRTIAPALQRRMSQRSKAKITQIDAGHLLQMSHPSQVVAVIEEAASQ